MNNIVFGVHHWPSTPPTPEDLQHCEEWYTRIIKNIPDVKHVFIATGCKSKLEYNPFPKQVQIVQNKVPYTVAYSKTHNYFRNGFMTGIWSAYYSTIEKIASFISI